MAERITLQDELRAMEQPDEGPVRAPCCGARIETFALVKLTDEEAARLGSPFGCGSCLAGPPVAAVVIIDPSDPWGDNETANGIRAQRSILLTACDWTQVGDAPLAAELKENWRLYRQALRDLTETFAGPLDVEWPAPPA